MPPKKRKTDETLSNGSIIFWSRRKDPYVPVKCAGCNRVRKILLNNTTRKTFTGTCTSCTRRESRQNVQLENGSIIFWSRRDGQYVPVRCSRCGQEHRAHGANIRKISYTGLCRSCLHTGPTSTTWRGGQVTKRGYIYVKVYPDHPFYDTMANSLGYIAEHRLVMAEHLGYPLDTNDLVHHRNGNKTDNRIENLELFISKNDLGKKRQERHPHPGHTSADGLAQQIIERLKDVLSRDE
jgi:hypothetical protein